MYGYYYFDPTYLLLVIGMVLSLLASAKVKSTFSVYSRVRSASGLTGADAARRILRMSGITDVTVVPISGSLTDHYDPGSKKLALSQDVYDKTSVAAIGVAAHECGHAIQHATNYVPLNLRSAIVPVANIGSTLSWPLFLAGLIFSIRPLLTVGIILFTFAVLFQLVTLPVEFNASSRALKMLGSSGMLGNDEVKGQLAERGMRTIESPFFHTNSFYIEGSNAVGWIPEPSGRYLEANSGGRLGVIPLPGEKKGEFVPKLFWHERLENDPLHQWVRSKIISHASSMDLSKPLL